MSKRKTLDVFLHGQRAEDDTRQAAVSSSESVAAAAAQSDFRGHLHFLRVPARVDDLLNGDFARRTLG